jgi:hypothetical protein
VNGSSQNKIETINYEQPTMNYLREKTKMKKLITICLVAGLMLAATSAAQAAVVNVSLEPSTDTVVVGNPFDLDLWLRSSDGSPLVMSDIHLLLTWDPVYVGFNGSASTADGDYDWTTAMSYPPMDPIPMYLWEGSSGENETYTDGDAWIQLTNGFVWLHPGMSDPQTDLKALTLTFTALAETNSSTLIDIQPCEDHGLNSGIIEQPTGNPIGGIGIGSNVTIVPEPATIALFGLGALSLLRKRRA